jgi:cyclophilin family peptidyl-prolyl cis-trans isomerase
MKKILTFLLFSTLFISCTGKVENGNLSDGLYALIETSKGDITIKLEFEKAPFTVANFVTLAEGKNNYVNSKYKGIHFYDGLTFHRVEANPPMIQGGDPLGSGQGGPGYKFKDEFHPELNHGKAGILSMANSGPNTNGSQFFITTDQTPYLDRKHSVFGEVVEGLDIVSTIVVGDKINTVKIIRNGDAAKKFDAVKVFKEYFDKQVELQKVLEQVKIKKVAQIEENDIESSLIESDIKKKLVDDLFFIDIDFGRSVFYLDSLKSNDIDIYNRNINGIPCFNSTRYNKAFIQDYCEIIDKNGNACM